MYLLRGTLIWLLIVFVESIHGTARRVFLEPRISDLRARQVSVFTGCVLIFAISYFFIRWIGARGSRELVATGALWVAFTLVFEVGLGRVLGYSWDRIVEDYHISRGGLMVFGLLFMLFAPYLAARLRGIQSV